MMVMCGFHFLVLSWLLWVCLSCRKCQSMVIPDPAGCVPLFCHEQSPKPWEESDVLLPVLSEDSLSEEKFSSVAYPKTPYEQEPSNVKSPWVPGGLGAPQWGERDLERWKRLTPQAKPNSLDLTFHLLRELFETSKAKKIVQKAQNNKKLLQAIGK